jgi:hypothetical protein
MFPYSISQGAKANPDARSTVNVEKMEVNVAINPADFAVPASLKQSKPETAKN